MNKLDFFILFLHYLTGNDEWMNDNKLSVASAYYGNYDSLLESLKTNNPVYDLSTDKQYFYNHLGTTEDEFKKLSDYELEYDGDFSRGSHMLNIDLGFGEDAKIFKRDDSETYYFKFNPNKLSNESVNLTVIENKTTEPENLSNNTEGKKQINDNDSNNSKTFKELLLSLGVFSIIFKLKQK